ncbi:hypothetical protein WA158_001181 [Blastocystis sp. Blastoise]
MFEDIVSNLLSKYLGEYIKGIEKENLKISLFKGKVALHNLEIQTSALDFLNLPIQIKSGYVGTLTLDIPWNHLGTKPTIVELSDIFAIACPKSELVYNEEKEKQNRLDLKKSQIKALDENETKKQASLDIKEDNSTIAKFTSKIIDNLQLRISNLHIRYEDHSTDINHPFSLGVVIEELFILSINSEGSITLQVAKENPQPGIIRKQLSIKNFGIYWDFDNNSSVSIEDISIMKKEMLYPFNSFDSNEHQDNQIEESSSLINSSLTPSNYILSPMSLKFKLKLDTRPVEIRKPKVEIASTQALQVLCWNEQESLYSDIKKQYISFKSDGIRGREDDEETQLFISYYKEHTKVTITSVIEDQLEIYGHTVWDIINTAGPMAVVEGNINTIGLIIDKNQYRDMISFVSNLSEQTLKAKYKRYKPKTTIQENPKLWWKFVYNSLSNDNQHKQQKDVWKQYKEFKADRDSYINLYKSKLGSPYLQPLSKNPLGMKELNALETKLDIENVVLFRKLAEIEVEMDIKRKEEEDEEKKKNKKGFFSIFKSKSKDKDKDDNVEEEEEEKKRKEKEEKEKEKLEQTRLELYKEFEIDKNELAPWEGGRPKDIQIIVNIQIDNVNIILKEKSLHYFVMNLDLLNARVYKRKEYLECWCSMLQFKMSDGSHLYSTWPDVLYSDSKAIIQKDQYTIFTPQEFIKENHIPFLQFHMQSPSLDNTSNLKVTLTTLPLCMVCNVKFFLNLINFFIPDMSKLNLYAFEEKTKDAIMNITSRKATVVKEVNSHKTMELNITIGSLHLLFPEDCNNPDNTLQMLICKTGDIRIISVPIQRTKTTILDEHNIYDEIQISLENICLFLCNSTPDWTNIYLDQSKQTELIKPFIFKLLFNQSISPSDIRFPAMKLDAILDPIYIQFTPKKISKLMEWALHFSNHIFDFLDSDDYNFNTIGTKATEIADGYLTSKENEIELNNENKNNSNKDTSVVSNTATNQKAVQSTNENANSLLTLYSDDDKKIMQSVISFICNINIHGFYIALNDNINSNHIDIQIKSMQVQFIKRLYDMHFSFSLQEFSIYDSIHSDYIHDKRYIITSSLLDEQGCIKDTIQQTLVDISMDMVTPDSSLYPEKEADLNIQIHLGNIGVNLYRPTIYFLCSFISEAFPDLPSSSSSSQNTNNTKTSTIPVSITTKSLNTIPRDRTGSLSSTASSASCISSISANTSSMAQKAAKIIEEKAKEKAEQMKKNSVLPTNWERNSICVSIEMGHIGIVISNDVSKTFIYGSISGCGLHITLCPALLSIDGYLNTLSILDKSPSAIDNSIIFISSKNLEQVHSINDNNTNTNSHFMYFKFGMYMDTRYPKHPNYNMDIFLTIAAPIFNFRMKYVNEFINYITYGPIANGLLLLTKNKTNSNTTSSTTKQNTIDIQEIDLEDAQSITSIVSSSSSISQNVKSVISTTSKTIGSSLLKSATVLASSYIENPFIIKDKEKTKEICPYQIPKVHIQIDNIILSVPRNTKSQEYIQFQFGQFSVDNTIPTLEYTDHYNYNQIQVLLKGLKLTSSIYNEEKKAIINNSIIPGIDLQIPVIISTVIKSSILITDIVLTINEAQIAFFVSLLNDNMSEEPEMFLKDREETEEPINSINNPNENNQELEPISEVEEEDEEEEENKEKKNKNKNEINYTQKAKEYINQKNIDNTTGILNVKEKEKEKEEEPLIQVDIQFCLESICIELLTGDEGYEDTLLGSQVVELLGTKQNSMTVISMKSLQIYATMYGEIISTGISIGSMSIKDTRYIDKYTQKMICDLYRYPIFFGEQNKPAISIMIDITRNEFYKEQHKDIKDINMSVYLSSMKVLPSPWIWELLDTINRIMNTLKEIQYAKYYLENNNSKNNDAGKDSIDDSNSLDNSNSSDNSNSEEHDIVIIDESNDNKENNNDSTIKNIPFNLSLMFYIQNPTLCIVQDVYSQESPSLLCTLNIYSSINITPELNIDVNCGINDLRICRPKFGLTMPNPDFSDIIQPFTCDVCINIKEMKEISVKLVAINSLLGRFGIRDIKLVMACLESLKKPEEQDIHSNSSTNSSTTSLNNITLSEENGSNKSNSSIDITSIDSADKMNENELASTNSISTSTSSSLSIPFTILLSVNFPSVSITMANDAHDIDIPVIFLNIHDINSNIQIIDSTINLSLSLQIQCDIYNKIHNLYEPFMEQWGLIIILRKLSDDAVNQQLVEKIDSEDPVSKMNLSIDCNHPININVNASLIANIIDFISDYETCDLFTSLPTDNYYITIQNNTGLEMFYRILSDENVSSLIQKNDHYLNQKQTNLRIFSTFCEVYEDNKKYKSIYWLEIYNIEPKLRFFSCIPVDSTVKPLFSVDSYDLNTNVPVSSSLNPQERDIHEGCPSLLAFNYQEHHYIIYFQKNKQYTFLYSILSELLLPSYKRVNLPIPDVSNIQQYLYASVEPMMHISYELEQVGNTHVALPLPAFPAFILQHYGLQYQPINRRLIEICIPDNISFTIDVDESNIIYYPIYYQNKNIDLIFRPVIEKGYKRLYIESIINIENYSPVVIDTAFMDSENHSITYQLKKNDIISPPVSYLNNGLIYYQRESRTYNMQITDITNQRNTLPILNFGTPSDVHYLQQLITTQTIYNETRRQAIQRCIVRLKPIFKIQNLLPIPLYYKFYFEDKATQKSSYSKCFVVLSGDTKYIDIYDPESPRIQYLHVKPAISDYKWNESYSNFIDLNTKQGKYSCLCKDFVVRLDYTIFQYDECPTIQISCKYWIVNKTRMPVVICEDPQMNSLFVNAHDISISSVSTPSSRPSMYTENDIDLQEYTENRVIPALFSFEREKKNKTNLFVNVPGYNFSKPLPLHDLEIHGDVLLTSPSNSPPITLCLSISHGDNVFRGSSIITITYKYYITNACSKPLKIQQEGTTTGIIIPPQTTVPYSLPSLSNPSSLSFGQADSDILSYPLSIEKQGSYPIQLLYPAITSLYTHRETPNPLKDKENLFTFTVNSINLNNNPTSQCNSIKISPLLPEHAPYCLANKLLTTVIQIVQVGSDMDQSIYIYPLTSVTWFPPLPDKPHNVFIYYKQIDELDNKENVIPKGPVSLGKTGSTSFPMRHKQGTLMITTQMHLVTKVVIFEQNTLSTSYTEFKKECLIKLINSKTMLLSMLSTLNQSINDTIGTETILDIEKKNPDIIICIKYVCDVYTYLNKKSGNIFMSFNTDSYSYESSKLAGNKAYVYKYIRVHPNTDHYTFNFEFLEFGNKPLCGVCTLFLEQYKELYKCHDYFIPIYQVNDRELLFGHLDISVLPIRQKDTFENSLLFNRDSYVSSLSTVYSLLDTFIFEDKIKKYESISINNNKTNNSRYKFEYEKSLELGIFKDQQKNKEKEDQEEDSMDDLLSSFINSQDTDSSSKCNNNTSRELSMDSIEENSQLAVYIDTIRYIDQINANNELELTVTIGNEVKHTNTLLVIPTLNDEYPFSTVITYSGSELGFEYKEKNGILYVTRVDEDMYEENEKITAGMSITCINEKKTIKDMVDYLEGFERPLDITFSPISHKSSYSYVKVDSFFKFSKGLTRLYPNITLSILNKTSNILLFTEKYSLKQEEGWRGTLGSCSYTPVISLNTSLDVLDDSNKIKNISISLHIDSIGLSIIDHVNKELLFLSINNIKMNYDQWINQKQDIFFKIDKLQVDNCLLSAQFPVVFGSKDVSEEKSFLVLSTEIIPHPSVLYIKLFNILIQQMNISIESHLILELLSFIQSIDFSKISLKQTNIQNYLTSSLFSQEIIIPNSDSNNDTLFIEDLKLQPLYITITNRIDPAYPLTGKMLPPVFFLEPLQVVLNALSGSLGNVEDAILKFNSFISQYIFSSISQFTTTLMKFYMYQAINNWYKLIGSVNFLGNPAGLLDNIGTGVHSFFYEPINGIQQGPNEFGRGLQKGTILLLENVSFGLLNTTSKIVGSLGDVVATASFNDDFKTERANGKKGLFHSLTQGITGVVMDPIKGAKKKGFLGALEGVGKGVVGLVAKPVTGILDEVNIAIDKGKKLTNKEHILQRIRNPRYIPFSTILLPYSSYTAKGQMLYICQRKQFNLDYRSASMNTIKSDERYIIHVHADFNTHILLLTEYHIFLMTEDLSVLWCHEIKEAIAKTDGCNIIISFGKNDKNVTSILLEKESYAKTIRDIINLKYLYTDDLLHKKVNEILIILNDSSKLRIKQQYSNQDIAGEIITSVILTTTQKRYEQKNIIGNIRGMASEYTAYVIQVESENASWTIYRRYSEFIDYLQTLQNILPNEQKQSIPMLKKDILMIGGEMNSVVVERRKNELMQVINCISKNPIAMGLECTRQFFIQHPTNIIKK